MKTTIYDLLGMVKDGNAPKKIRFHCGEWVLTNEPYGYCKDYYSEDMDRYLFGYKWALTNNLNDEVEILEESKENIKTIDNYICAVGSVDNMELADSYIHTLFKQQNQVIDRLNKIIHKINKESDK